MPRGLSTTAEFFVNAATKWPRKPAIIADGRAWTYAEIEEASAHVAGWMRDNCGVGPGKRVAISMRNCAEAAIVYWAALRLGAAVLPVNYKLNSEALTHLLREGEPACLAADEPGGLGLVGIAAALNIPLLCTVTHWDEVIAHPPADDLNAATPDAPAVLLYTSGTTGLPKAAIMTHEALVFNVRMAIIAHSFRHEDIHLLAIPLFVPTACYSLFNVAAYLGSTLVLAPDAEMGTLVPLIEKWRCTTFFGVPTMFFFLTSYPRVAERDLSSLRLIAYSGSPMPVRTIRRLRELFPGVMTHNFFGLTETIAMTHVLASADAETRPESIGKLLPEIDARVVDDVGGEVAPGEVGELVFRRDVIIPEYWRRPGLLEESLRDGWFHTGDLASVDEDGYFQVHGRSKDMIIVAGQNVYALEVEQTIMRMEKVREVAVVGIEATGVRAPLGELILAVVVPHPGETMTEAEVKRHCAGSLPTYKVPHVVEFREALPRNPAGKVLKRVLAGGGQD